MCCQQDIVTQDAIFFPRKVDSWVKILRGQDICAVSTGEWYPFKLANTEPRYSNGRTNCHDVPPGMTEWEAPLTFGSELAKNMSLNLIMKKQTNLEYGTFCSLVTECSLQTGSTGIPWKPARNAFSNPQSLDQNVHLPETVPHPSPMILSHATFEKGQFYKIVGRVLKNTRSNFETKLN